MYEITHKDNEKLQEYIAKHIAYEGGIYDFTQIALYRFRKPFSKET